jgi:SAM-dependent methyltransferase
VPLYESRDRLLGLPGKFGVRECTGCGSGVLSPRPLPADLPGYYPDEYPVFVSRGQGPGTPLARRVLHRALRLIPTIFRDPSLSLWDDLRRDARHGERWVLDVGCGPGKFLQQDVRAGWRGVGLDFSQTAVARASALGLDVRLGSLEDADLEPERFDLVRMSHVIEHLEDPEGTVRQAFSLLRPGGRLHIATPNFASPDAKRFGTYWFDLDSPRHLVLFTPASLRSLCERVGFVVEREVHEVTPRDFLASLTRWARDRHPTSMLANAGDLRYAIVLRQLLHPYWWVLARLRRGDRMHFVFRKPEHSG